MANAGESIHICFICTEEAYYAHGSAYNIYWLCEKHNIELWREEKTLKEMIEMQALRNIKERYLIESAKEEDCPVCHGAGATTDHHDPCTECGGSGKVGG